MQERTINIPEHNAEKSLNNDILSDYKQKIFSVRNDKRHKVIHILGLKIKIKNKKYSEKEQKNNNTDSLTDSSIIIPLKDENKSFSVRLSQAEKELITGILAKSKNYLEFGSGGSTILAIIHSEAIVHSVESDTLWLNFLRTYNIVKEAEESKRLNFYPIFIGQTKEWGYPVNDDYQENYPLYSSEVFNYIQTDNIDTCFIDGRFRVACAIQAVLRCPNIKNILIHDYSPREQYHIVEKFLNIKESIDTLFVFEKKDGLSQNDLVNLYEQYKYIKE